MSAGMTEQPTLLIVSSDLSVAEFLRLEAIGCGWSVTVLSALPRKTKSADAVIFDARNAAVLPNRTDASWAVIESERTIGSECSEATFRRQWPISLADLQYFLRIRWAEAVFKTKTVVFSVTERNCTQRDAFPTDWRRMIHLTPNEERILSFLEESKGQTVMRENLMQRLRMDADTLNVHMCHLRKKLERPFGFRVIETVRGRGYRLNVCLLHDSNEKKRTE